MLRAIVAFLVLLSVAGLASADEADPITPFAAGNATMNAAIADAQRSLPLFLCESVDDEGYGPDRGFLKVRVPVKSTEMTHAVIWVGPFAAWDGQNFAGLLANQPHAMPGLNRGDQLDFTYEMIVDWSWGHPSGNNYGDYTTRVIYAQEGDDTALAALAQPPFEKSWTCE